MTDQILIKFEMFMQKGGLQIHTTLFPTIGNNSVTNAECLEMGG
jgi:hypothetical protein